MLDYFTQRINEETRYLTHFPDLAPNYYQLTCEFIYDYLRLIEGQSDFESYDYWIEYTLPPTCPYSVTTENLMFGTTFEVRFISEKLTEPEYIGPFYSEEDAYDYADSENTRLVLAGIPSWVTSYSVV